MTLKDYLAAKTALRTSAEPTYREHCYTCHQSAATCYCHLLQPFTAKNEFIILIHTHEVRRRIATGRMSHLTLANSKLITGEDFTNNDQVNELIASERPKFILYPGRGSVNLTKLGTAERTALVPENALIFVIDGTWRTARKMMHLSRNLSGLPQICFTPPRLSGFKIRKQPAPECFSTIEAIHHLIDLLEGSLPSNKNERTHDRLLHVFHSMVKRQLVYTPEV